MNDHNPLHTILAFLLGEAGTEEEIQTLLAQVAAEPSLHAQLERLEKLLTLADDPAWLEDVAAAAEGVITPAAAELLADLEALAAFDPAVAAQIEDALSGDFLPDETLLPPLPAVDGRSDVRERWQRREDFEWRLREAGELVIRLLAVTLTLMAPLSPTAVKGDEVGSLAEKVLRRCVLEPDDTGDLAVEVIISQRSSEPDTCRLTIRAESVTRWPDMGGIAVQASAGHWQVEGVTDDTGEAVFEGLPENLIESLLIKMTPT